MHDGELPIDVPLVHRLVRQQFPELGELPVRAVRSTGTVNAIYRIGDRYCARFPRKPEWAGDLERECRWLPVLAPHLSLHIPRLVRLGHPDEGYPSRWAVLEWIEGRPYSENHVTGSVVADELAAAGQLAQFILELRQVPPHPVAPPAGRPPLGESDEDTRAALRSAADLIDADAAVAAWDLAVRTPPWTGTPRWIHADLLPPNVLIDGSRITAVIDFGAAGMGDPAADVIAGWTMFGPAGRRRFREILQVDNETWCRAAGYALTQAAMIIPYYRRSNPAFALVAVRTVQEVTARGLG